MGRYSVAGTLPFRTEHEPSEGIVVNNGHTDIVVERLEGAVEISTLTLVKVQVWGETVETLANYGKRVTHKGTFIDPDSIPAAVREQVLRMAREIVERSYVRLAVTL